MFDRDQEFIYNSVQCLKPVSRYEDFTHQLIKHIGRAAPLPDYTFTSS
jgi:hypothetical protein